MGNLQAMSIADITEAEMPLRQQIAWHLSSNHYPAVPAVMVDVCLKAIQMYHDGEDMNQHIELPDGVLWKDSVTAPAVAVCENFHLEAWTYAYDPDVMLDPDNEEEL